MKSLALVSVISIAVLFFNIILLLLCQWNYCQQRSLYRWWKKEIMNVWPKQTSNCNLLFSNRRYVAIDHSLVFHCWIKRGWLEDVYFYVIFMGIFPSCHLLYPSCPTFSLSFPTYIQHPNCLAPYIPHPYFVISYLPHSKDRLTPLFE